MDEYIRKADALAVFRCRIDKRGHFRSAKYITEYEAIERLPAADVRPVVRGKWLHKEITDDFHAVGQCSVCKERRRIDNFCPNCGADMRGET